MNGFPWLTIAGALPLAGALVIEAPLTYQPAKAGGIDKALLTLRNQPFGEFLMLAAAVATGERTRRTASHVVSPHHSGLSHIVEDAKSTPASPSLVCVQSVGIRSDLCNVGWKLFSSREPVQLFACQICLRHILDHAQQIRAVLGFPSHNRKRHSSPDDRSISPNKSFFRLRRRACTGAYFLHL